VVVGLLVSIEGIGVPVPGELALVVAAAFAAQGDLSLTGVILASSIGTIIGGSGGYWLGRTGGLSILERYGHLVGINDEKLGRARQYFSDHGVKTIILSRFVAILRILAGLLAGVAHMPFGLFTLCNAVGGILWSIVFALLGNLFGSHLPLLVHYIHRAGLLTLGVIVAAVALPLIWRRR
jgi:membrane protein DedA with SNARE-associated domain